MRNIIAVYGTRPEEIKLYPLSKYKVDFLEVNQSKDLHQGLIVPRWKCTEQTLVNHIHDQSLLIVQGDTRTAFRAALLAYERGIPVAHVEAGLRTHDLTDPHPEEGYRAMIDAISTYKFAPNFEAQKNCDGILVGQTSIDTLMEFIPPLTDDGYTLVTMHRSNADVERWVPLIKSLPNPMVIAHPNSVGQSLKKHFKCIAPVPYKEFVALLAGCTGVATDSGGLQEEALALGKPVTLLREKSERGHGENYYPGATEKIIEHLRKEGYV